VDSIIPSACKLNLKAFVISYMRKDIAKGRKLNYQPPKDAARQEGSTTKLKMRADKKREPKE
jgi:hypothetical protein